MTFGQLLFWILVAIIAYFLLEVGLAILIVAIVAIVVYYLINSFVTSTSTPTYAPTYAPTYTPYYVTEGYSKMNLYPDMDPLTYNMLKESMPINFGSGSGHSDYWYIPVQNYYDEKMNTQLLSNNCTVPQSTSEYCVDKHMKETGDLNLSISKCTVPGKTSANCAHNSGCF